MSAKYTPGPWHVGVRQAGAPIYDSHGWQVAEASPFDVKANAECKANARLIAEAPAMVEALRTINDWTQSRDGSAEADEMAIRAIENISRAILARIEGSQ